MISTRTHGIIDYAVSAALFATPRLLGWDRTATRVMDGAAVLSTAYAHLTDYELGAYPLLSMKQHLAVDALEGAAFLAAAWMMDDEPDAVRGVMAGYGLFALGAALLTDREPKGHPGDLASAFGGGHGMDEANSGGRRTRGGAWVMDDDQEDTTMHLDDRSPAQGRADLAEREWRQARRPAPAAMGANNAGNGQGASDLRAREWQRARPDGSAAQKASAGRNTHSSDPRLGPQDARRGYMAGQGI